MYQSNNFKFGRNAYATSEEYQAAEQVRRQEEQDYEDSRSQAISWTAKSGQELEVYVHGTSIQVHVHGKGWYDDCEFSSNVPEAAKAAGIVAKLGPIGVTAEQKSAIQAKMGR